VVVAPPPTDAEVIAGTVLGIASMFARWEVLMWLVVLDKEPVLSDFRSDYFPRKLRYKADALELVAEVERKGGKAHIERVK
jgi:hypothetical protein